MKRLVLESLLLLLYLDLLMVCSDFKALHSRVKKQAVRPPSRERPRSDKELCHAVDLACVFYCKQVFCLQRSAATTIILRRHGWNAELVIGAEMLTFRSHAWVEVEGTVVNDRPYMQDMYRVLERC